jgi:SAM-dependent MidA family methyltransferase
MLKPWIVALGDSLSRGALLLIDYGLGRREYYHPQRGHGTLRCHFRHRAHDDALLHPGLQDITAWVDFTRVAEAAVEAQLEVGGYCTQAAFLLANGIESELAASAASAAGPGSAAAEQARLASEARQLLLPGEMGESFKVMALTRGLAAPLRGFEYQDLRPRSQYP